MLADTDIFLTKKKPHRFFYRNLLGLGLFMSATLILTACNSNNGMLGTIDKTAQTSQPSVSENNSGQSGNLENGLNSGLPPEQNSNSSAKIPVPTQMPAQNQKAVASEQQAMQEVKKSGERINTPTSPQVSPLQQPTEQALTEEQKPKKTALFSFGKKKADIAPVEQTPAAPEMSAQQTLAMNGQAPVSSQVAPSSNGNEPSPKSDNSNIPPSTTPPAQSIETSRQAPERDATSQKKGSLMRLFGRSDSQRQNKPVDSETKAALVPLPKKDPHEYNDVLPGVRPNGGIVIKHRTSLYDDTDIDANEIDSPSLYTLASVSLYGRSLPNGLKVARKDVEVSCLRPQLVAILKTIERRFNKPVIITSGYRSPAYNQKVNGAKRSMHMSCAAADIQVPDTDKWEVAKFVRALPNRGGVGTYCHQSIHVDVGPKRDWNWSCSVKN